MKLASLALCVSVSLSSCFSLGFEPPALDSRESRTMMRVDGASGALEWLSIDRGVRVRESNGVAHLRAVLAGARIYPIEGGITVSMDVDLLDQVDEQDPLVYEFVDDLTVMEVGLAEDTQSELVVWRLSRLDRATYWLALFQRPSDAAELPELGRFPTFDPASLALQNAASSAGEAEWRVEGRTLVFEVPSTLENALLCQDEILSQAARVHVGFPLNLRPSSFHYSEQRFAVRYMPRDDGWFVVPTAKMEAEPVVKSVSVDDLRAAGLPIESHVQLSARLAQLGIVE
jgi:hypothetical protein